MGFDKKMHAITIAEDAGHELRIVMRDGRVFDGCFIELIADKTITISYQVSGKSRRTRINPSEITEVIQVKDQAA